MVPDGFATSLGRFHRQFMACDRRDDKENYSKHQERLRKSKKSEQVGIKSQKGKQAGDNHQTDHHLGNED